jgi:hypothetical protein
MNKLKKIIVFMVMLVLMVSMVPLNASYAQTGSSGCIGKYKCYGCKNLGCEVYKVQNITTYYSYDDCKKVVDKASKTSNVATVAAIFTGSKSNTIGSIIGLYGGSVSRLAEPFKTAIVKQKGLEVSYEFVITKINASSFARKSSVKYR